MAESILSLASPADAGRTCLVELNPSLTESEAAIARERATLASSAAQQIEICAAELLDVGGGYLEDEGCVPRALLSRVRVLAAAIQVIVGEARQYQAINEAGEVVSHG